METRERIYDAAMKLFAEKNFETVTIEMITESADVGKGTFFNYFENKEAVIRFQFEERLRMISVASSKILSGVEIENYPKSARYFPKTGGVFWRRMVALVRFITEYSDKNQHLTRTVLALSLTNPAVRQTSLESKRQASAVITELIKEGLKRGELRTDFAPEEMAHILYSAHLSTLLLWAQAETEGSLSEAIDRTYAMLWRALRNPEYLEETGREPSNEPISFEEDANDTLSRTELCHLETEISEEKKI